jgi:hypothetical protein
MSPFREGSVGTIILEVYAEDMYFAPWEKPYIVKVSKKVVVKDGAVKQTPTKPQVTAVIK